MCIVKDGLQHVPKRVKSYANFSTKLRALHLKVFLFSKISVHGPGSEFPGDGRRELGQPTSFPESGAWV